ncbi:hypothetical protein HDE_04478 [Halotydeus destructor]|nr:hypothetical protein HDE_04478 [Halotydeus destructor]
MECSVVVDKICSQTAVIRLTDVSTLKSQTGSTDWITINFHHDVKLKVSTFPSPSVAIFVGKKSELSRLKITMKLTKDGKEKIIQMRREEDKLSTDRCYLSLEYLRKNWMTGNGILSYQLDIRYMFEIEQDLHIEKMRTAFLNANGADFSIVVNGKSISCSKFFLLINSNILLNEHDKDTIEISDTDYVTMKTLVKSMYVGFVEMTDVIQAMKIHQLALRYEVDYAITQSKMFIEENLSKNNVLFFLQEAHLLNCSEFKTVALDFLSANKLSRLLELPGYHVLDKKLIPIINNSKARDNNVKRLKLRHIN